MTTVVSSVLRAMEHIAPLQALALEPSLIIKLSPTHLLRAQVAHDGEPLQASLLRCAAKGISVFAPHTSAQAVEGEGRIVTLQPPRPLDAVVASIKQHLGLSAVQLGRSANGKADVSTIAICAGSGGSASRAVAAVASGSHVLLFGHTNTERDELAADQDVEILVSQKDHDPLTIL
ncbi:NGG1p interacting factor 3 [Auriculariales sp. MPI-PUGE-AT-0066]|nr:NGG1p interacting factor 3 [Auriculariales sp. MPI-PUGE-AT-0066]